MTPPPAEPLSDRPRRGKNPRLKTTATLVAIPDVAIGGTASLLNLSTTGACVEIDGGVEQGQAIELKLAHPKLTVVPSLQGEVMWLKQDHTTRVQVGLQFLDPTAADPAVRPFLTAEAGSCVFQREDLVGFVVPHGKARKAWSLFDDHGKRLAVAARDEQGFEVHPKSHAPGALPSFHVSSLFDAVCASIELEGPLRLDPPVSSWRTPYPLQEPAAGPPPTPTPSIERDASGRLVRGASGPLGSLCETGEPNSWLVVDPEGRQLAYLSSSGDAGYQICSMADAIDDRLEFKVFPSLEEAAAAVLEAQETVEIDPPSTVGRVSPLVMLASTAGLDRDHAATQIVLTGFPKPEATQPQPKPKPKTSAVAAGPITLRQRLVHNPLVRLLVLLGALALAGWIGLAIQSLVRAYTT